MTFNYDSQVEIDGTEFGAMENLEKKQQLEEPEIKPEAAVTDLPDKTII